MNELPQIPTLASALWLRLADFTAKPVVEQARVRAQLEAVVAAALSALPEKDRVVLDTPDGVALVVLGNAVGALETAQRCLDAAAVLPLCIGGHYGAVAPVADHDSTQGMIGDGLRSAATAAEFASPGQMLTTRSFREAVSQQSPVRRAELLPAGTFTDASVRTHELFVVDRGARARRRRKLMIGGAAFATALLAASFVLRLAYRQEGPFAPRAEITFAVAPGGEVFIDGKSRGTLPELGRLSLRAGQYKLEVRHGADPPLAVDLDLKPGQQVSVKHVFVPMPVLSFDVSPGGEVFVDGKASGTIPPLQRLELAPGTHVVEVRNGAFAPFRREVKVKRGDQLVIEHAFALATMTFKVSPGGQVFVNGKLQGSIPALKRLELYPGRHTVEVRYGKFPPYKRVVDLQPGQQLVVQHEFQEPNLFKRLFKGKR